MFKELTENHDRMLDYGLRVLIQSNEQYRRLTGDVTTDPEIAVARQIFDSIDRFCPLPYWEKSQAGVMLYQNQAYEQIYKVARLAYIGGTDSDAWDEDNFDHLDREVVEKRRTVKGTERGRHPQTGDPLWIDVWKWPRMVHPDEVIVCGLAIAQWSKEWQGVFRSDG